MSKTNVVEYTKDWKGTYDYRRAMEEAARCLLCHDAPCSKACPAGTDPAKFIRSLRFKNIYGGAKTIRENNPLGGTCSLVCPYEHLCEEACSRCGIDRPIDIGGLQKFLVLQEKELKLDFTKNAEPKGKSVACIGAGPASLSCARQLAQEGYNVTVFESKEKIGGMLTYAIPPFRLPQDMLDFDLETIKASGIKFICEHPVDASEVNKLLSKYDAVFVGVGLANAKVLDIPGNTLEGVISALDFLREAKHGDIKSLQDKKVVVIGGGDVALDCAATAKSKGAKATIVYRRTREEAPATSAEMDAILSMGVTFISEFAPLEILGSKGKVTGFAAKARNGNGKLLLDADYVVIAIGQNAEADFLKLKAKTGLFMGGDIIEGTGKTVVEAVGMGKEAALNIAKFLTGGKA